MYSSAAENRPKKIQYLLPQKKQKNPTHLIKKKKKNVSSDSALSTNKTGLVKYSCGLF